MNSYSHSDLSTIESLKVIIAGRKFEIECKYQYVLKLCTSFQALFDNPDEVIRPSQEELTEAAACFDAPHPVAFCVENEAIHRRIFRSLLPVNCLHVHGAAVAVNNRCWIFSAPSGTGKTTHVHNWLKMVPGAWILDGDKPFIDLDTGMVYSSPWCGKEQECINTSVPLAGLVYLQRGSKNSISQISIHEMLYDIIPQIFIPPEATLTSKAYELLGRLLTATPLWRLHCTADPESALVSWEALSRSDS